VREDDFGVFILGYQIGIRRGQDRYRVGNMVRLE